MQPFPSSFHTHPILVRCSSALHGSVPVLLAVHLAHLVGPHRLCFGPGQVGPWHGGHGVSTDVRVLRVGRGHGHYWLGQAAAHRVWWTEGDTSDGPAQDLDDFLFYIQCIFRLTSTKIRFYSSSEQQIQKNAFVLNLEGRAWITIQIRCLDHLNRLLLMQRSSGSTLSSPGSWRHSPSL